MAVVNPLAPSRTTRWLIAVPVVLFFAVPLAATLLYTLRDGDGVSLVHWASILDPAQARGYAPVWTGLGNSLVLAVVTVGLVLVLVAPTLVLVHLRFPRLRQTVEFLALLPISVPAIVLVVGLVPIYLTVGRTLGTGAWTLAFAYGITVLPFAFRSIQTALDAVDLRTLTEAARTLGASWPAVLVRVVAPNIRSGLLAASLISTALVLGEFTIASLLNRPVLQTGLVVVQRQDAYSAAAFTLLALAFAFLLLLVIGVLGRPRKRTT